MIVYQPELSKMLLWLEFFSAIVALIYYNKLKKTNWKWFVYYLIFIFVIEKFGEDLFLFFLIKKTNYFAYFGIPIQFIFFYWLYAVHSLKRNKIFYVFSGLFIFSFLPIELFFSKLNIVYSLNITVGTFFLMILILLEFNKQIKSDNILNFYKDKMFYINIGVILFYIGTLPFFAFYNYILEQHEIYNKYYVYFLVSNCIMYFLFAISFICGKTES